MTVTAPTYDLSVGGWKPWRVLRDRDDVEFALVDLPDGWGRGIVATTGTAAAIMIDRSLPPRERHAVLAHELVHLERGVSAHAGGPEAWQAVRAREERIVDRIVAERLVPLDELEDLVARRSTVGPVTVEDVADEFDVSADVAANAINILKAHKTTPLGGHR